MMDTREASAAVAQHWQQLTDQQRPQSPNTPLHALFWLQQQQQQQQQQPLSIVRTDSGGQRDVSRSRPQWQQRSTRFLQPWCSSPSEDAEADRDYGDHDSGTTARLRHSSSTKGILEISATPTKPSYHDDTVGQDFVQWFQRHRLEFEQGHHDSDCQSTASTTSSTATALTVHTRGSDCSSGDDTVAEHDGGDDDLHDWDFIRLPAETILDILRHINGSDIVRLSCTSKRWRAFVLKYQDEIFERACLKKGWTSLPGSPSNANPRIRRPVVPHTATVDWLCIFRRNTEVEQRWRRGHFNIAVHSARTANVHLPKFTAESWGDMLDANCSSSPPSSASQALPAQPPAMARGVQGLALATPAGAAGGCCGGDEDDEDDEQCDDDSNTQENRAPRQHTSNRAKQTAPPSTAAAARAVGQVSRVPLRSRENTRGGDGGGWNMAWWSTAAVQGEVEF